MTVLDTTFTLVDCQESLNRLADRLVRAPAFGVDTESNSLYRYFERVCLIQISLPDADYIVDPLVVNPGPLREAFASADVQKVMHAGEYDVMCLTRDYGFEFRNIFDTMVAARTLGLEEIGLAPLIKRHFGATSDKRFQRANWEQRPLPSELLGYAVLDAHYLIPLRDILRRLLEAQGKLAVAEEAFQSVCRSRWRTKEFDPEGYMRLPGARDLAPRERSVLRELYLWREETAQSIDRPPFRVARPDVLVKLAMMQPKTASALELVTSRHDSVVRERAQEVLECICRGQTGTAEVEPAPREGRRRRPGLRQRVYERLCRWRREQAEKLGLPIEQVLASDVLGRLAAKRPHTQKELEDLGCLAPAQLRRDGGAILALVNGDGGGE
ncbi:MAG: ribonuclease D [Anaerolineae bacterium]|jgi:ribonuclease D